MDNEKPVAEAIQKAILVAEAANCAALELPADIAEHVQAFSQAAEKFSQAVAKLESLSGHRTGRMV
jgi:hypothetical protein